MRDYARFDKYLDDLTQDVRPQPADEGHKYWATAAFSTMLEQVPAHERGRNRCLDVGCGDGFMEPVITAAGLKWSGVSIGADALYAMGRGLNVRSEDMSFLTYEDGAFDLIFARHVLEHSPFPVVTLMEWRRVCAGYLLLVAPTPDYWEWYGRNHYAMANIKQLRWWLRRAGWYVARETVMSTTDDEFNRVWRNTKRVTGQYPGREEFFPEVVPVEYRLICKASLEVIE
jgi:SAM-dependent methyltransferase